MPAYIVTNKNVFGTPVKKSATHFQHTVKWFSREGKLTKQEVMVKPIKEEEVAYVSGR
jgi:hypothetical protein